ncbi:hypothetical protein AAVH_36842, partial [Aphelenchoides avenae]
MAPARPHKCTECAKAFSRPAELKRHVSSVHGDARPHVCEVCGRGFKEICDLRRHRSTVHETVKKFKCDECHMLFTRSYNLRQHKLRKHATAVPAIRKDGDGVRPLVCATCGFHGKDLGNFWRHKKTHEPGRKFQCP